MMKHEEKIREVRPHLSPSFLRLADFILDSYTETAFMTATELAEHLEVDAATVVRFAQRLGYPGYPVLQREIRSKVKDDLLLGAGRARPAPKSVDSALDQAFARVSENLTHTRRGIRASEVGSLVSAMNSAKRIILLAEGESLSIAQHLASVLQANNLLVYEVGGSVADMAHLVGTAKTGDVVVAVELEQKTPFIARALEVARRRGAKTAALVGAASQEVARHGDLVLAAHTEEDRGVSHAAMTTLVFGISKVLEWKLPKRRRDYVASVQSVQAFLEEGNEEALAS